MHTDITGGVQTFSKILLLFSKIIVQKNAKVSWVNLHIYGDFLEHRGVARVRHDLHGNETAQT